MKTIGLFGGTSWVSTVEYYRLINELTNEQLGGLNYAKIILQSVNFHEFKSLADAGNWKQIGVNISAIAQHLQNAGADCLLLCANTPHIVADTVQQNISIPLIHIAEETAKEIVAQNLTKVALLGTRFTMDNTFFTERLLVHGIETVLPDEEQRDYIHSKIFSELGKGIFNDETKNRYLQIIESLRNKGAQGVIFGCTEIPILIRPSECNIPVFDTTIIHAKAAVRFSLSS
jgi:aspartate racemase